MSAILWNIRGAGSEASLLYLKDMIRTHKPVMIVILEPKQHARKIGDFARKIGFEEYFHGDPINTHIWIFWRRYIDLTDFTITSQSISFNVHRPGKIVIKFTTVYAKCNRVDRLALWKELRDISDPRTPWIIGGNFNIILNIEEKKVGVGSIAGLYKTSGNVS